MPEGRWHRSPRALWRQLTDGVLVLGPLAVDPVEATGPGAELWSLLERPLTADEAANRLAERYGTTVNRVLDDIEPVLARWIADGAIEAA